MNKRRTTLIILLISLILTGCVNIKENDRQETRTLDLLVENTKTITPTVTNILSTATTTVTVLPTLTAIVEPSFTPSPNPSLTPLPTLNNNDANRTILELANTNGKCEMPCLWGIVPGETQWETINQYYTSLRFEIKSDPYKCKDESKRKCVWYTAKKNINDINYGFGVTVEDGIVKYATVRSNSAKKTFSLDHVLNEFGVPSDIYIDPPIGFEGVAQLPMYLFYDQYNLRIYFLITGTVFSEFNRFCPYNNEVDLWVTLFEPNSSLYYENKEAILIPDEISGGRYYPIEELTELTQEDFYELFINKAENNCFDL